MRSGIQLVFYVAHDTPVMWLPHCVYYYYYRHHLYFSKISITTMTIIIIISLLLSILGFCIFSLVAAREIRVGIMTRKKYKQNAPTHI